MTVFLVALFVFAVVLYCIPTDRESPVDLGVILGNIADEGKDD